jgi:hypothetical protein
MSMKGRATFRRLILIGTPILTGILLLFHPLPESADRGMTELPKGLALYEMLAPIADGFLVVHLLFPLALGLLGLSVILLLNGVQSVTASISRGCAFIFVMTYIMYETIIGDLPSLLSITAWLSWILAITLAAFALRRSGKPFGTCILLGLSFIFVSHASMLGPLGMLFFLFGVRGVERVESPVAKKSENEYERTPV